MDSLPIVLAVLMHGAGSHSFFYKMGRNVGICCVCVLGEWGLHRRNELVLATLKVAEPGGSCDTDRPLGPEAPGRPVLHKSLASENLTVPVGVVRDLRLWLTAKCESWLFLIPLDECAFLPPPSSVSAAIISWFWRTRWTNSYSTFDDVVYITLVLLRQSIYTFSKNFHTK